MVTHSRIDQAEAMEVVAATTPIADAAGAAQSALQEAVAFTAQKMGISQAQAKAALRQNLRNPHGYFKYGLARQVAQHLAAFDHEVKTAYLYDDEATPEDESLGEAAPGHLVHMIIRVRRKTEALNALIAAVDRALARSYAGMAGAPGLAHVLDAQVIDEDDVAMRTGYGALLTSLHHRPVTVWER